MLIIIVSVVAYNLLPLRQIIESVLNVRCKTSISLLPLRQIIESVLNVRCKTSISLGHAALIL